MRPTSRFSAAAAELRSILPSNTRTHTAAQSLFLAEDQSLPPPPLLLLHQNLPSLTSYSLSFAENSGGSGGRVEGRGGDDDTDNEDEDNNKNEERGGRLRLGEDDGNNEEEAYMGITG